MKRRSEAGEGENTLGAFCMILVASYAVDSNRRYAGISLGYPVHFLSSLVV